MATRWTTPDFERLSWHDCCVHGLGIVEGPHGAGELELDLDFIVEWICREGEPARFRVAPATLAFHEVSGLRLELDYAAASAGMVPFALDGISREPLPSPTGHASFRWLLAVSWPRGSIGFEAPGFTQVLRSEPRLVDRQHLLPAERGPRAASG